MKSIVCQKEIEKQGNKEIEVDPLELLRGAVNYGGDAGLTVLEMHARLRLLDKINDCEERVLFLEDADFEKLGELFKAVRWTYPSKTIVNIAMQLNLL